MAINSNDHWVVHKRAVKRRNKTKVNLNKLFHKLFGKPSVSGQSIAWPLSKLIGHFLYDWESIWKDFVRLCISRLLFSFTFKAMFKKQQKKRKVTILYVHHFGVECRNRETVLNDHLTFLNLICFAFEQEIVREIVRGRRGERERERE